MKPKSIILCWTSCLVVYCCLPLFAKSKHCGNSGGRGSCEHECRDGRCVCPHGYQLDVDQTSCIVKPTLTRVKKPISDEQRLLRYLMTGYDKSTRPVFNSSHTVSVKVGITLTQIFDVDEKNQVLTTHIWLDQEWTDEHMDWNPADYGGLQTIRVPSHLIWKPDIVLYNSADDYTEGYMPALAMVSYNGHVFWPPIVRLRSTCKIDITYFPFDDQKCFLKLGSWAYDGFQVDVLKRDLPMDLSRYVSNGEWELINVKVVRKVEQYSCCPEPYPDVTFTLHMRRRTLYYTYNVIIPCIMLSCLTLLSFWMPPEGGEKVALGLTVLLAFSVFMLLIAENMPATSFYVPLIGLYIIVAMGLTSGSVVIAVFISHLHHKSYRGAEVPKWLRDFSIQLRKIVTVHRRGRPSSKTPSTAETTPDLKTPLRESFSSVNFTFKSDTEVFDLSGGDTSRESSQRDYHGKRKKSSRISQGEEIMKTLNKILLKQEELIQKQNSPSVNKEWQDIAEVIDRFLFWIYFVVTFTVTVAILVLVPLGKAVQI